ncbi:metallo-beta-lactamase superfamily protein [Mycoplasma wenyonii str. Massachusetts]|uniref:Metallo-beta-lactamase superfamily protein n=1 Tax=Mycoplasma wenyonii (strain Massachusetts) TaxID=1197325 RepID=I6ZI80_MYCWM|nr:ribonuclease J [Mycoplasma wenyonii]AFN64875.1 metallo-beta-lactamase superfamily protein [Mycoplasma wenyonii str. Massachusetts]
MSSCHTIEQHIFEARNHKCTDSTYFFGLGGIEEIGKNCYCIEHKEEILILDFGIKFGNKQTQPGVTGLVANLEYLIKEKSKIVGLFITHGHEDHIGGIVHLLNRIDIPVIYAPALASELIKKKIEEHKPTYEPKMVVYNSSSLFFTKYFGIDFFEVNHSIPDSFGFSISTPNGYIAFSGDFRFDLKNKINSKAFQRLINIGSREVDLLLCESTAAAQPGFNESELTIIQELKNIISSAKGRIIITFFASNLGRIEEIVKLANSKGRRIAIFGRSIESSLKCSQAAGLLNNYDLKNSMVSAQELDSIPDDQVLIICTGSQGEESSALSIISKGSHPFISLKPTDDIIFSSNAIPGNKQAINELVNRLYKTGCNIHLNSSECRIHASGHATKLEQQLFISFISPKYLAPIHGEKKMLHDLKRNVVELNIVNKDNIFILKNGSRLELTNREVKRAPEKDLKFSQAFYVIENKLTDKGKEILDERTHLASHGLLVVSIALCLKTKVIHSISPISTIGSLSFSISVDLFRDLNRLIRQKVEYLLKNLTFELNKESVSKSVSSLVEEFFSTNRKNQKVPKTVIVVEDIEYSKLWEDSITADYKSNEQQTTKS